MISCCKHNYGRCEKKMYVGRKNLLDKWITSGHTYNNATGFAYQNYLINGFNIAHVLKAYFHVNLLLDLFMAWKSPNFQVLL